MRSTVILALLMFAVMAAAAFVGAGKPGTASAPPSGSTVRGAIGGDFDAELPLGAVNGADWGVDVSLPKPAGNPVGDRSIHVNVSRWSSGAANLSGVSIIPRSGASRFGFKLIWDSPSNGDSFIDAVWAYHYP